MILLEIRQWFDTQANLAVEIFQTAKNYTSDQISHTFEAAKSAGIDIYSGALDHVSGRPEIIPFIEKYEIEGVARDVFEHTYASLRIAFSKKLALVDGEIPEDAISTETDLISAEIFGDVKELIPSDAPLEDSFKDQWNNSVGREIAQYMVDAGLEFSNAMPLIYDAYINGQLITNYEDTRIPSDLSEWKNPSPLIGVKTVQSSWNQPSQDWEEYKDGPKTDPSPEPQIPIISITNAVAQEGDIEGETSLVFHVDISGAAHEDVTFTINTSGNSKDYHPITNQTVTVSAEDLADGFHRHTIEVRIKGDTLPEKLDDVMSLTISNVTGANLSGGGPTLTATGTIKNDDDFDTIAFAESYQTHALEEAGGSYQRYFYFETDGEGRMAIDIKGMTGDVDLEVLDYLAEPIEGAGISSSNSGLTDERVEFNYTNNQGYFIKVSSDAQQSETFDLQLSFIEEPAPTDPDLVISNVRFDGISVDHNGILSHDFKPGDSVVLSYDVVNQGGTPAPLSQTAFVGANELSVSPSLKLTKILQPGESVTYTTPSFVIPENIADGHYTLGFKADSSETVEEGDESNNQFTLNLNVNSNSTDDPTSTDTSDVSVSDVRPSGSSAELEPGGNMRVLFDVHNDSQEAATDVVVNFVVRNKDTGEYLQSDGSSNNILKAVTLGTLGPNNYQNDQETTFALPDSIPAGNWEVGVVIQSSNESSSNQGDNSQFADFTVIETSSPQSSDVSVSDVRPSGSSAELEPGGNMRVLFDVHNDSQEAATDVVVNFVVRNKDTGEYLQSDGSSNNILKAVTLGTLGPNNYQNDQETTFALPDSIPAGNWEVGVVILSSNESSSNQGDNSQFADFTVIETSSPQSSDVSVSDVRPSGSSAELEPGGNMRVLFDVHNDSQEAATDVVVNFVVRNKDTGEYLQSDGSSNNILKAVTLGTLGPNNYQNDQETTFALPDSIPAGNWEVGVVIQSSNESSSNQGDNSQFADFTVIETSSPQSSDVSVSDVRPSGSSAELEPGGNMRVLFDVHNDSQEAATDVVVNFVVRNKDTGEYLQSDGSSNNILKAVTLGTLGPNNYQNDQETTFALPDSIPAGNWEVGVVIQSSNESSSNQGDNSQFADFTVIETPRQVYREDETDTRSWAHYTDTFNDNDERIERFMVFDDGREALTSYENGVRTASITTDVFDSRSWATVERSYEVVTQPSAVTFNGNVLGDDDFTDDMGQGLQFLDVTLTQGLSYSAVLAELSEDGALSGFRYASADEVRTMATNLGFLPDLHTDTMSSIVQSLGVTYPRDNIPETIGYVETADSSASRQPTLRLMDYPDTPANSDQIRSQTFLESGYDKAGHFLVRDLSPHSTESVVKIAEQTTTYDDGRILTVDYTNGVKSSAQMEDVNDTKSWLNYVDTFDFGGDRASRVMNYDDGRELIIDFVDGVRSQSVMKDFDDVKSWDNYTIAYDAEGSKVSRTLIYDDGREVFTSYVDDFAFV